MTSLADRIKSATPGPYRPNFREWLASLNAEEIEAFEAFGRSGATVQAILEFVWSEDVRAGKDAVSDWKRRLGNDAS